MVTAWKWVLLMASAPHDKTGKRCWGCDKEFTKNMMTCTTTTKEEGYIVFHTVCKDCKLKEIRENNTK